MGYSYTPTRPLASRPLRGVGNAGRVGVSNAIASARVLAFIRSRGFDPLRRRASASAERSALGWVAPGLVGLAAGFALIWPATARTASGSRR